MKDNQVGKNMSSGAEKVENISRQNEVKSMQNNEKEGGRVELNKQFYEEKERANRRIHHAVAETERRKARAIIAERRKAKKRERKAKLKAVKEQRKHGDDENSNKKRAPGYSGWLAAVISLGATCLVLATIVTVGAIEMSKSKQGMVSGYRSSLYELIGVVENIDDDLDRARISASPQQQSRILTDMLVQARIAEIDVEKLPISAEQDENLSAFFNKTAHICERLLTKIRDGEELSESDLQMIDKLYTTAHSVRATLNELSSTLTTDDMMNFLKGDGEDRLSTALQQIEQTTMEENRLGMGMGEEHSQKTKDKQEKSASQPTKGPGEKMEKIDLAKAEQLVNGYFSQYAMQTVNFIGETHSRGIPVYNYQLLDKDENRLDAQLSALDGTLVKFNYFKECSDVKYDTENAKMLAQQFLSSLGYENVTAVRVSEMGTDGDFLFCYETDGVIFYTDAIKVKVCLERGIVSGMDASQFLRNHRTRVAPNAKLNLSQVREKLSEKVEVESVQMCVIQAGGKERCAYEFLCSYNGEMYFIYVDADTGRELSILNVKNIR